jgi:hypothetical protein
LTWRVEGESLSEKGIVAQYLGTIANGRMDGFGSLVTASALRYEGGWKNGLVAGHGELMLPSGDAYVGGFASGVPHGKGRYIATTGVIYEGGFDRGKQHGPGRIAKGYGKAYASVWHEGEEIKRQRTDAPAEWVAANVTLAQAKSSDGLRFGLTLGTPPNWCCLSGPSPIGYLAKATAHGLVIAPDSEELLLAWNGELNVLAEATAPYRAGYHWNFQRKPKAKPKRGPLTDGGIEGGAQAFADLRQEAKQYSFLNYTKAHLQPLLLQMSLENMESETVRIVGGYVDVEQSRPKEDPLIQVVYANPYRPQRIAFVVENYGWVPADVSLTFRVIDRSRGRQTAERTVHVGMVDGIGSLDLRKALISLGVRDTALDNIAQACEEKGDGTVCLSRLRASGVFGELAPYVRATEDGGPVSFGVDITGRLNYEWTSFDGVDARKSAPFEAFAAFGTLRSRAECEGTEYKDQAGTKPFMLSTSGRSYRIRLTMRDSVPAGVIGRWRVRLDAPQSSTHKLRLVLELADGRRASSRSVELLYYKPRFYSEAMRALPGRC